ncbi:YqzL family protein [Fictibacillus sp. KIGAM418]|uniref:YqzL family protein n=1 Tax=Fictibacillus marinisediminis TaxID=2878389 RepID=A0A9X1XBY8_9BACL|nr:MULTISPECIES: YqzL family protein [Fictibacillus]MCK6257748.1 YqzL family protein [Fictibacillus marinisediminis]UZJ80609.1 YqzL family protein [Fictibacillus sp. KU28468]
MKEFTWKVFCETGSIDTYLLFKELEVDMSTSVAQQEDQQAHIDSPIQ